MNVKTNGKPGMHVRDKLHSDMLAMLDKFRRIEGEAMANNLLRGLLTQSNQIMNDLGFPPQDETTDLQVQLMKEQAEGRTAKAYANHFGQTLRSLHNAKGMPQAATGIIDRALKWEPGQAVEEDPVVLQDRATH